MRSIEGDSASVRTFLRVPVMNIFRRQERNAASKGRRSEEASAAI